MNAKLSLALIALVGVGVFALPSTMALFAGQHSFYNIDATGNQIPCQKCHGDVKAELSNSGYSAKTGTLGPHANFQCEYCHRAEAGFASGDDAVVKLTYSNVTGPATLKSVYVVTTIQNFETGNFPKQITGVGAATKTIDWTLFNAKNLDLTTFVEKKDFQDTRGFYAGQITGSDVGIVYNMSRISETATYSNGAPLDQNATTKAGAVDPSAVTISSTGALNFNGSGSRAVTPGTRYHAASLVSCMECHGGEKETGVSGYEYESPEPYMHSGWLINGEGVGSCADCHYSTASHTPAFEATLAAGGFGITGSPEDTGSVEAHNAFVKTDDKLDRFGYGASNGACIACHTHVAVDINFQKGYKLAFDAIESSTGQYSVANFAVEGQVNVAIYGNGSGMTYGVGDKTYNWTPGKTLYLNGGTATINGLNGETNDSAAALQ
ncbi:Cytochrome c7 c [uncultured archaeon]|nr:Cytochrome c7 c [uncultured archaeon]